MTSDNRPPRSLLWIGRPLLGRVIAERAGHAMHAALVSRIMQDPSLYEVFSLDEPAVALEPRAAYAV